MPFRLLERNSAKHVVGVLQGSTHTPQSIHKLCEINIPRATDSLKHARQLGRDSEVGIPDRWHSAQLDKHRAPEPIIGRKRRGHAHGR